MGEAYYKPLESKCQNKHKNVSMTIKRRVNMDSVTCWVVLHVSLLSVFFSKVTFPEQQKIIQNHDCSDKTVSRAGITFNGTCG